MNQPTDRIPETDEATQGGETVLAPGNLTMEQVEEKFRAMNLDQAVAMLHLANAGITPEKMMKWPERVWERMAEARREQMGTDAPATPTTM